MATKFAVVHQAAPATNTTQDFESVGFGTPDAAIFLCSVATALDTDTNHASMSIGFTDGTNHACQASNAEYNQASSDTWYSARTDRVINILDAAGDTARQAASATFGTDKVTVTWSGGTTQYLVTCVLIQAEDAEVGTFEAAGSGTTEVNLSGAFQPDAIMFFTQNLGSTKAADVHQSWGAAERATSIKVGSLGTFNDDAQPSVRMCARADDTVCCHTMASSRPSQTISVDSFDADGFTAIREDTWVGTACDYAYLALRLGNGYAVETDTLNDGSSADQAFTTDNDSGSFQPTFLIASFGEHSSFLGGSSADTDDEANTYAIAVTDGTNSYCHCMWDDDDNTTSQSKCRVSDQLIYTNDESGNVLDGDLKQFDSGGFTIDWTSSASARCAVFLAMEGDAVAADASLVTPALGRAQRTLLTM